MSAPHPAELSAGPAPVGGTRDTPAGPIDRDRPRTRWLVRGASVAGSSHRRRDEPLQDAHLAFERPDGVLVVAVADGAGSAERSAEGAALAVERAVEVVDGLLGTGQVPDRPADDVRWAALLGQAFVAARALVDARAAALDVPARSLACTLTCVVATDGHVAVAQVGDGCVVARRSDGVVFPLARPARGEYANETTFLTEITSGAGIAVEVATDIDAIAVMTDGLLRLATDRADGRPHEPFFAPLWRWLAALPASERPDAALADFLASDRVAARTDDDVTLVLAVRAAAAPVLDRDDQDRSGDGSPGLQS